MPRKQLVIGQPLPNIPWQDRPKASSDLVWRHSANPIIDRHPIPIAQAIYNSAVVPLKGRFVGVFRTEYRSRLPYLHLGRSDDGLHWNIEHHKIHLTCKDPDIRPMNYAYDPRVCRIGDTYYVTWCNGYHGPTIGIARTKDFKHFEQMDNAFLPCNRNGVLFPRKINGKFAMLSRPSDMGHTPFGDIFYSQSPDMIHWGHHRFVMGKGGQWWQSTKVGAGPIPIETTEGWLLFYHGVITQCNGYVYSMGAALLDRDEPWRVKLRSNQHLLAPEMSYENCGFVPNVVFPCAALSDAPTGRLAIYYGAADTYTCVAYCYAHEVLRWLKENSQIF